MESTKVFLVENVDWELSRSSSTLKVLEDAAVCVKPSVEPVFVLFRHCFFFRSSSGICIKFALSTEIIVA